MPGLVISLYASRELLSELVRKELRVRYRRSVLGLAWSLLQPLATATVLYVAFSELFRFRIDNYPVYALAGILFWNFFSQSVVHSMNSLRSHSALLLRLPVPRAVFPLAAVFSGVVHLLLALLPLLAIVSTTGHSLWPSWGFLPVSLFLAGLFTAGAGLALAPLAVRFHDVTELVQMLIGLLFFLTPVIYPLQIVPERWIWLVRFNPLRSILEVFRDPIFYGKVPPASHLAVALVVAGTMFLLGLAIFRRLEHQIGTDL